MDTYETARARQFTAAATTRVIGSGLAASDDARGGPPGHTPHMFCLCVTEPCNCPPDPIVWVQDSDILETLPTQRRTSEGDQLNEYVLRSDATVLVESVRPMSVGLIVSGLPWSYWWPWSCWPWTLGSGRAVLPSSSGTS